MIFKLTLRKTTEDFDKKWIVEVIVSCRIITEGVKNQEKSNGFLKLYNRFKGCADNSRIQMPSKRIVLGVA